MRNKLKLEEGLSMSARDFCDITRNTVSPNETPEQAENRLSRYGQYHGELLQNIAFSNVPPSELILDWIIDDGQTDEGRPHRRAIFNPNISTIGIASGPHSIGRVICVLFCEGYSLHGTEEALPLPGIPFSSAPTSQYGSNKTYPEMKIGGLISTENNLASILPISSLGCDVSELYLGIRENGNAIEFRRAVDVNGKIRREIQSFALPYQVTRNTISAIYYPNRNGGEIIIRLGKQESSDNSLNLELEIMRFTVLGNPGSNTVRVPIGVDQQQDNYTFEPGPPSKFNTDFSVVLNGNILEFRSTHSFEEGDSVKTVNGKQSVQLPFSPTIDQMDISGSTLTIWPSRKKVPGAPVLDSDVNISVG